MTPPLPPRQRGAGPDSRPRGRDHRRPAAVLARLYEARFGTKPRSIAGLAGDGSARKIYRLSGDAPSTIGVVNDDLAENRAFLSFSKHFRRAGLPVPEIYAEDQAKGAYLEEDLGDRTLFDLLTAKRRGSSIAPEVLQVYRKAAALLPRFQITAGRGVDLRVCWPRAEFDRQSILWDLNYFKYYFLRLGGFVFDEQRLEEDFALFAAHLLEADRRYFLYRDFQSRNIMVRSGEPWFIDYQGGRRGALQYDVASLLYDAKADLPEPTRKELLEAYLRQARKVGRVSRDQFMRHYPGYVYVRIFQALGTYGLRGFFERKPHFLQSIPYAMRNIEFLLRERGFPVEAPELVRVLKMLVATPRLRLFGNASLELTVRVQSFSYKRSIPADDRGHGGGFVFDCRALPNPGRLARYAELTGRDRPVAAYLSHQAPVRRFLRRAEELVADSVKNYRARNFTDLSVAFGCTGGRHRSVFCAEAMASFLRGKLRVPVQVEHRDL